MNQWHSQLRYTRSSKSSRSRLLFFLAKRNKDASNGFSLLELVTALAILSAVSAIALVGIGGNGGILSWATRGKIDEAKAILNAAAADCLQKNRINTTNKDKIDPEIISGERIETLGYKLDGEAQKCSYLQILPISEEDEIRFPMGFSVSNGRLSKFATPTSTDESSLSSCRNWAGINCKQDESLKSWIEMLMKIEQAKKVCTDNYQSWLSQTNPPADGPWNKWNASADSGCPSRPPQNLAYTPTCTPNGCNSPVYAFEGKIVGTQQEDYTRALDEKYGELCKEWVQSKLGTNNQRDTAATSEYCGSTEFWFCDDPESNKQQWGNAGDMNNCLNRREDASCKSQKEAINQAKKPEGRFKPNGTTLECQEVWFCFKDNGQGGNPYDSETDYNTDCKDDEPPAAPPPPCSAFDRFLKRC